MQQPLSTFMRATAADLPAPAYVPPGPFKLRRVWTFAFDLPYCVLPRTRTKPRAAPHPVQPPRTLYCTMKDTGPTTCRRTVALPPPVAHAFPSSPPATHTSHPGFPIYTHLTCYTFTHPILHTTHPPWPCQPPTLPPSHTLRFPSFVAIHPITTTH